jgi:hypothetical protein
MDTLLHFRLRLNGYVYVWQDIIDQLLVNCNGSRIGKKKDGDMLFVVSETCKYYVRFSIDGSTVDMGWKLYSRLLWH